VKTFLILLVILLAAFPAFAQDPEATAEPLTLYSHPTERYHIVIPPGWRDFSTPTYMLMEGGIMVRVFARSTRTPEVAVALAESLSMFLPGSDIAPDATETLILPNGTWTRVLYPSLEGGALTAYVQSYEGVHYVLMFMSATGARPLVVPLEDARADGALADAARAAVTLIASDVTLNDTAGDSIEVLGQAYTPFTARDGTLTAWTRIVGSSGYVLVTMNGEAPDDAAFFTILLDFFLTPETTDYLALGVVAVVVVIGALLLSLIVRARNLRKDMATLREIERTT